MEKIYNSTFGGGAEELADDELQSRRVEVTDVSGNRVPIPLRDVWETIGMYFDDDEETGDNWQIHAGVMTIYKPASVAGQAGEGCGKRQRAASDKPTKVCSSTSFRTGWDFRLCWRARAMWLLAWCCCLVVSIKAAQRPVPAYDPSL